MVHKSFANRKSSPLAAALTAEIATRANVSPWLSLYDALPNPDPVLFRTGKRIEILHEIKREPHVSACSQSRKSGVKKRLWKIERYNSNPASAELIEKIFENLQVRDIIRETLDGWGYGYKPLEILWQRQDNLWLPFCVTGKPPEWFEFGRDNELRLKSKDGFKSTEVEPYKFLLASNEASYSNPYGEAQYSLAFWPTTFKKGGLKFWALMLEKFGMPHAVGKAPANQGDTEKDKLLTMLQNLIQDAVAVIPDNASVELLEIKSGSGTSDIYEKYARYHDGEISKVILGHAAAADSTPGRLGGENGAMDVRGDIIDDDSFMVMDCMDDLIRYIFELNPTLGTFRPRFELYDDNDVDTARADRDFKLMNSKRVIIKKGYFTRCYDFRDNEIEVIESPSKTEPTLPANKVPPAEFSAEAQPSAQDEVDSMLTGITPATEQAQAAALLQPVIDLVNRCESFDEVQAGLLKLYPDLKTDALEKTLEKAMLLAHIAGGQPAEITA
jgi:phage gp29-like protein